MNPKSMKVAVLYGGNSSERQISLKSGHAVWSALKPLVQECVLIDAKEEFMPILQKEKPDFVFIALHGKFGEDGDVQELLESEGYVYSGPSIQGCRNAMNKAQTRRLFEVHGLKNPKWELLSSMDQSIHLQYPFFVKPANGGSSIGVSKVENSLQLRDALLQAFREDQEVIVEEAMIGREMAIGVVGDQVFDPIEIIPERDFYDYEAKYFDQRTQYVFPEDLVTEEKQIIQYNAQRAFRALGLDSFARLDFIYTTDGEVCFLEGNAIPGMTEKSLLPKMAARYGWDFGTLCLKIIEESLKVRHLVREPKGS